MLEAGHDAEGPGWQAMQNVRSSAVTVNVAGADVGVSDATSSGATAEPWGSWQTEQRIPVPVVGVEIPE